MKFHKNLTKEKWFSLSFFEQMAHMGSEAERAILWREKNQEYSKLALFRALELLDLTREDPKNKTFSKLKELGRLRECLVDYFYGNNIYKSLDELWKNYFYVFNYAARKNK